MKYPEELEHWLALYLQGGIDEEQKQKLEAWLKTNPDNEKLLQKLQEEGHWQKGIQQIAYFEQQINWEGVIQRVNRRHRNLRIRRIGIAASIVMALGVGYLLLAPDSQQVPVTIARIQPHEVKLNTASGKSYSLDSAGRITTEGTFLKSNGEKLEFKARPQASDKIEWNTVEVPRGTTYKVVLSDQTEVILNAESVLHFPNNFENGKSREIWLEGEAYFNVTKDTSRLFIAHTKNIDVKVLGTKFNLMAYEESKVQQITLVQGKVEVSNNWGKEETVLTPGFQATFDKNKKTMKSHQVDTNYYTAWVEDLFAFRETPLSEVMRMLSQWYDFEYFFQNQEIQDFIYTGKIKRYDTLNEVLENFKKTGDLNFSINNNVVIISKAHRHKNIINNKNHQ